MLQNMISSTHRYVRISENQWITVVECTELMSHYHWSWWWIATNQKRVSWNICRRMTKTYSSQLVYSYPSGAPWADSVFHEPISIFWLKVPGKMEEKRDTANNSNPRRARAHQRQRDAEAEESLLRWYWLVHLRRWVFPNIRWAHYFRFVCLLFRNGLSSTKTRIYLLYIILYILFIVSGPQKMVLVIFFFFFCDRVFNPPVAFCSWTS
jgi:hypothetical protein